MGEEVGASVGSIGAAVAGNGAVVGDLLGTFVSVAIEPGRFVGVSVIAPTGDLLDQVLAQSWHV